jgi:hypothetical protein
VLQYAPRTPGTAGYHATTPGGLYNPTTPGVESATPGTVYSATTPGVGLYKNPYEPSTPGAGYNPATPGGDYTTPGFSYETPGHPHTPGAAYDLHMWATAGIEVTLVGGAHGDKAGIVTDVEGTVVRVRLYGVFNSAQVTGPALSAGFV